MEYHCNVSDCSPSAHSWCSRQHQTEWQSVDRCHSNPKTLLLSMTCFYWRYTQQLQRSFGSSSSWQNTVVLRLSEELIMSPYYTKGTVVSKCSCRGFPRDLGQIKWSKHDKVYDTKCWNFQQWYSNSWLTSCDPCISRIEMRVLFVHVQFVTQESGISQFAHCWVGHLSKDA